MKKIVAAVDFSEITGPVIEQVTRLAKRFESEVLLLHVADANPDFVGLDVGPQTVRDHVAHELREEHKKLQVLSQELRDHGVNATALVTRGPVVDTVLKEVREHAADLVVLGSHGHGAVYRLVLGSVSEGVIRACPCPVLVIPCREK